MLVYGFYFRDIGVVEGRQDGAIPESCVLCLFCA